MATRFNRFYATELAHLRTHSLEFAQANPAVAPMLGSVSTDPDVERLLEGVAFLNGLTRQKLDDEFPEIVQELASVLVPQFLRPLPATSMVAFAPKAPLNETTVIEAGTEIAATPLEGISCLFRTTARLHIAPLTLESVNTEKTQDGNHVLQLQFHAPGASDAPALPDRLRLFLTGDPVDAANLFMLLNNQVQSLRLRDQAGHTVSLPPKLGTPGFDEPLLPYPDNAFPAFSWMQELLFMPQKFLFIELTGLDKGNGILQGSRFRIEFFLSRNNQDLPSLSTRNFALHVTPVVNLFATEAEPIKLDHELSEYPVLPHGTQRAHHQIYSIDSVSGYQQGGAPPRSYVPFSLLSHARHSAQASYRTSIRPAIVGNTINTYLSVVYDQQNVPANETLSLTLTCTNRTLPERLKLGDISRPTSSSPERFTFRNITPVTAAIDPPHGEKLLWDVISHTTLNLLSLASIDNLRAILHLYNSTCSHDNSVRSANERQIEGLLDLSITPESRLVRGSLLQGQHIVLSCDEKNWPGTGTLYLWGCVLDRFLASYISINTYTRFEIHDKNTGTRFTWPMRMGLKTVL
ncbi:type VI secretion system baseplate subunit TssF [Castellaniella denitrificans]|uniref:Type VI secretion system baseplate subunit TssF n=1 Tax=Castellaniella denitrificans TaxID=56119 RepID=A0ABT4M457_9BURK|nr:type VI secretion system baseplate subunit TssF [Castellaniella denitrificans]MCZ4329825.1 type VI secretion system baseplate subunit TssF [Castellaniella denitrificans]